MDTSQRMDILWIKIAWLLRLNCRNVTNLKAALLTQYDADPTDFPAYEARRDFEAALDKVEATFLVAGKYGFPALTSTTKVTAPTTGVMIYGNNNFQGLSIDGTTACNITLYIRQ